MPCPYHRAVSLAVGAIVIALSIEQDICHKCGDNTIVMHAPPCDAFDAVIVPLWRATIAWTIDKPSPLPAYPPPDRDASVL